MLRRLISVGLGLALVVLWNNANAEEKKKTPNAVKKVEKKAPVAKKVEKPTPKTEVKKKEALPSKAGTVMKVKELPLGEAVWIPAGTFVMGSPKDEPGRDKDEGLQHKVKLTKGFWMLRTEVTQAQYKAIMGKNPSKMKQCGEKCPVEHVSWEDALRFANALSRKAKLDECYDLKEMTLKEKYLKHFKPVMKDGRKIRKPTKALYNKCNGWRLPTEAEWEYAARAGTKGAVYVAGKFTIVPNPKVPKTVKKYKYYQIVTSRNAPLLEKIAWYGGNSFVKYSPAHDCSLWTGRPKNGKSCGIHPVAQKLPNAWGLYDMIGNVYEWVFDAWKRQYPQPPKKKKGQKGKKAKKAKAKKAAPKKAQATKMKLIVDPAKVAGSTHILRGCSWISVAKTCRAAFRSNIRSEYQSYIGFRLVRTP